jgi:hypothetical protein
MPKDYQEVEMIVEEFLVFHRELKVPDELLNDFNKFENYVLEHEKDWLRTTLTTYGNARELEGVEKCIKLSDEIELREPDGGTKQWMAFKAFRNTMRDIINKKV